jgi:hypothetical protein
MHRWLRLLVALVVASLLTLGSPSARAAMPELGELPTPAVRSDSRDAAPGLTVPHDVPIVLPTAREAIPPVPASYVTKNLGWLELSYPPAASERVASLVEEAASIKAELTATLGQPVLEHVQVRVAPTVTDMARLAPPDAPPPEYASGVAYHGLHLVLLSMLAPRGPDAVDLDEVFRHELAHVALEDAVQGKHVPIWFNEGLAISLSKEQVVVRMQTLWSATLSDKLIPLSDLDRSLPRDTFGVNIAYAEAGDFMRFLSRKSDRLRFAAMIGRVREGQAFDRAVAEAYGSDLRRLELEWRGELEHRFSVIPVLTGGGLVWMLVVVALVAAYVKRRRRSKAILARWEREEALEDARIARMQQIERETPFTPVAGLASSSISVKTEHDGRWHTLH